MLRLKLPNVAYVCVTNAISSSESTLRARVAVVTNVLHRRYFAES
jgi:hypothetical protein